jgi:hypothetical protein
MESSKDVNAIRKPFHFATVNANSMLFSLRRFITNRARKSFVIPEWNNALPTFYWTSAFPTMDDGADSLPPAEVIMHQNVEKLLYSRRDAAEALSLSVRSVDYLITTRRLPMRRIGGKILIPAHAVRRFAREDHPDFVRSRPPKKQPVSVGSSQESDDSIAIEENSRVAGL